MINNNKELNHSNQQLKGITIKEKVIDFYFKDFHQIISKFKRSFKLALTFKVIYFLQLISLLFYSHKDSILKSYHDQIFLSYLDYILEFSKIFPLLSTAFQFDDQITVFLIFSTVLNLVFLLYFCFRLVQNLLSNNTNSQQFYFSDLVSSFFCQMFNHVLFIPFFEISVKVFVEQTDFSYNIALAIINLLITLLTSFILVLHDFDYSYLIQDYLAQRESLYRILYYFQDIILLAICQYEGNIVNSLLHIIFVVSRLYIYQRELPYYDNDISEIYLLGLIMHCFFSITCLIFEATTFSVYCDFSILLLLSLIPMIKFTQMAKQHLNDQILKLNENQILDSSLNLDLYVRNLQKTMTNLNYTNYCKQENGIYFEIIFTKHILNCRIAFSDEETCFCEEFQKEQLTSSELLDLRFRKSFIVLYIIDIFKKFFAKNQSIKNEGDTTLLRFSYVAFLTEIFGVPMKALSEITYLKKLNKSTTIKEKYVVSALEFQANLAFLSFFHNSPIQNQRIQMQSVLEYDELGCQIFKQLRQCLSNKRDFLAYLCQDRIDIEEVKKTGSEIIQQRGEIQDNLIKLYEINQYSKKCLELASYFCEYLDINCRSVNSFFQQQCVDLTQKQRRQLSKQGQEDSKIYLFDEGASIVFISLMKPLGQIKRVSNNFTNTFSIPREEAINQNCNMIMPEVISAVHDRFLQNFIENDKLTSLHGEIFTLGIRGNGFLIPLYRRMRLDSYDMYFGMSAYLLEINKSYDYLIINEKNQMLNTSQNIYEICFRSHFRKEIRLIHRLDVGKLIPFLFITNFQAQTRQEAEFITTLMIFPLKYNYLRYFQNKHDQKRQNFLNLMTHLNFVDFGYLEINFRKIIIDTNIKGLHFQYLEIEKIRRIKRTVEKTQQLFLLKKQVKDYLDMNVKVSKQKKLLIEFNNVDFFLSQESIAASSYRSAQSKYNSFGILSIDDLNKSNNEFIDIENQLKSQKTQKTKDSKKMSQFKIQNNSQSQQQITPLNISQNTITKQPNTIQNLQNIFNVNQSQDSQANQTNQLIQNEISITQNYVNNTQEECLLQPNSKKLYENLAMNQIQVNTSNNLEIVVVDSHREYLHENFQDVNKEDIQQHQENIKYQQQILNSEEIEYQNQQQNQSSEDQKENEVENKHPTEEDFNNIFQQQNQQKQIQTSYYNESQILNSKFSGLQTDNQINSLSNREVGQNKNKEKKSLDSMNNINDDQLGAGNNAGKIIDQSSLRSSQNTSHLKKKQFMKVIMQTKYTTKVKSVAFFLVIGLFILLMVTLALYLALRNNFTINSENYSRIQIGGNIQQLISKIVYNTEINRLNDYNLLDSQMTDDEIKQFINQMTQNQILLKQQVKYFFRFLEIPQNQLFLKNLQIYQIQTVIKDKKTATYLKYLQYNNATINFQSDNSDLSQAQIFTKSVEAIYSILMVQNYLFNYATYSDSLNDKFFIYNNFITIQDVLQTVQDLTEKETVKEIDVTQQLQLSTLITILCCSFLLTFMAIPLYAYIQLQKENILKLVATYPGDKLKQQIFLYDQILDQLNQTQIDQNNQKTFIKRLILQNKHRTISNTTNLKYTNLKLVLPVITIFLILSIYPILNYVIVQNYLNEFNYMIDEISLVIRTQGSLVTSLAIQVILINSWNQQFTSIQPQFIQLNEKISIIQDSLLLNFYNIDNNELSFERYHQDEYQDIFLHLFKINICDKLSNNYERFINQDYMKVGEKINNDLYCIQIYDGILGKGLIIALKTLYQHFQDLELAIIQQDKQQFQSQFKKWDTNYRLLEFYQGIEVCSATLNILKEYLLYQLGSFTMVIQNIILGIFIYGIFVQLFIIGYFFNYLINYLAEELHKALYFISIFNMDFIIENPYIVSFLENEIKK